MWVDMLMVDVNDIEFFCTGKVVRLNVDKGWCYVVCSKCSKKIATGSTVLSLLWSVCDAVILMPLFISYLLVIVWRWQLWMILLNVCSFFLMV
ncbi:unnamed protein product [Brassica oleracea]